MLRDRQTAPPPNLPPPPLHIDRILPVLLPIQRLAALVGACPPCPPRLLMFDPLPADQAQIGWIFDSFLVHSLSINPHFAKSIYFHRTFVRISAQSRISH